MHTPRLRFFKASKKAFLIKLVSVLGFGGMLGFCILGCDKQDKVEANIVETHGGAEVDAKLMQPTQSDGQLDTDLTVSPVAIEPLYVDPLDALADKVGREDVVPNDNVMVPTDHEPQEFQMSTAYGPPPFMDEIKQVDKPKKRSDKLKKKGGEVGVGLPDKRNRTEISLMYGVRPPTER